MSDQTNNDIADVFQRMGTLLEIRGDNVFKIKAYYKAADILKALPEDVCLLDSQDRLNDIPGIGKTLKEKIHEYLKSGKLSAYLKLTEEVPETLLNIVNIPSVGPKKAKLFYQELKISNLVDLKVALENGELLKLPGIREKTIDNIRKGMKVVESGQDRMTLAAAASLADQIKEELTHSKDVRHIEFAGSFRRGKETVGDLDVLVDSANPIETMHIFTRMNMVKSVLAHGKTKSSILTHQNRQVDLRIVKQESFGAALLYFTGSKNFNIKIRQIAQDQNKKVNEYGIIDVSNKKEKILAGKSEEDCFKALGLPIIVPELREDLDMTRLFSGEPLPELINIKDIRGELHVHSTWSDGRHSIEEMAKVAQAKGYSYLAISDHSQKLKVANGVTPEGLKIKHKEICELNKRLKRFKVLTGSEVEIDADGNLDYNEEILSDLDIVVAAVHSHFDLNKTKMTERLLKAISNPYVNILAHPTGRHIGKRASYDFDLNEICHAAVEHHVALEVNAFPIRLDLNDKKIYQAKQMGVKFVINTDAHHIDHFKHLRFGIQTARRGWLTKEDVLNTFPLEKLTHYFKKTSNV